jgi:hypothetical protein
LKRCNVEWYVRRRGEQRSTARSSC